MLSDQRQRATSEEEDLVRDIHALTPPRPQRSNWDARSSSSSSSNFSTMSREFNALVVAGSNMEADVNNPAGAGAGAGVGSSTHGGGGGGDGNDYNLTRIGEEEEETNPLAIVPDNMTPINPMSRSDHLRPLDPVPSPQRSMNDLGAGSTTYGSDVAVHQVKKEEIESKIYAWQTAKISKINNRFKREDAVIRGWEGEEVQKATTVMKKVERKLEEKRAKALEKMQNDIAKAHRKAEEKRASAEAKRGTKVARVLEITNLMRTLGRPPTKRSFF